MSGNNAKRENPQCPDALRRGEAKLLAGRRRGRRASGREPIPTGRGADDEECVHAFRTHWDDANGLRDGGKRIQARRCLLRLRHRYTRDPAQGMGADKAHDFIREFQSRTGTSTTPRRICCDRIPTAPTPGSKPASTGDGRHDVGARRPTRPLATQRARRCRRWQTISSHSLNARSRSKDWLLARRVVDEHLASDPRITA